MCHYYFSVLSVAKSEAEDMKIMLCSADKVMEEKQQQLQGKAITRDREFAALEAKVSFIVFDCKCALPT